jgi:HlyD family secretion protein
MKKIWTSAWGFVKLHKKTSIVVVIIIIAGIWYYHSSHTVTATTYVVKPVTIGTVETTVSGTGQVSSSQEMVVYPKVSGDVVTVNVKNGDTVKSGQVLATLDSTNAYYSLENAKIALEKLQTSSPISATSDQNSVTNAQNSLTQSYQSAFNTISSAYNDMGPIITNMNDLFYGKNSSPYFSDTNIAGSSYASNAQQYKEAAGVVLDKASAEYTAFRQTYLATNSSASSTVAASLSQELTLSQDLATAIKNTAVAINYIINQTPQTSRTSAMTTDQNSVSSWLSSVNQDVSSLSSASTGIQTAGQSLIQAQANLAADQTTNDPLDLQSAKLSLQQAQTTYDEYTITAPFDGIVGNVTLRPGDSAGASTAIATVVTKNYISTIVLNEVDVAKVAVGQPVSVTFNALPDVVATGTVTDVDSIGAVSQGVVSYNVVISFGTDNPQIKAGMSINANIVTAEADSVVVVPNGAVKTIGSVSYVQVPAGTVTTAATTGTNSATGRVRAYGTGSSTRSFGSSTGAYGMSSSTASTSSYFRGTGSSTGTGNSGAITASAGGTVATVTNKIVQIGLSDDTETQIISGLNPGDLVVTQTITGTATAAKSTSSGSILSSLTGGGARAGGGGGYTGGAARTGGAVRVGG